jgi:hypothetical protein
VLVGAIANFVTGIGELPYDMLSDVVSAGRAIGHPTYHGHTSKAWSWKKHRRSETSSRSSEEEEEFHESAEYQPDRTHGNEDAMSIDDDTETNNNFMANTLNQERSLQLEKTQSMNCAESPEPRGTIYEIRTHGSRMSKKLLKTIIWLPTDLTLSLSKGFHNAPKLYHDRMVKDTPKVIGFRSGLAAARMVRSRWNNLEEDWSY